MSPRRQRHPAAHSAASPHINSLPDDVLAHVLALAGADAANKAAALAVCAHWQRVAGASPEFWAAGGSIVLNGQKLEQSVLAGGAAAKKAFLGFLRRQRGVLRHLRLLTGTSAFGGYMPAVLGSLQGGGLAELSLELGAIRNYEPLPHRTTQRILKEVLALTSLRQLSIAVAHQSIHQDFTWAQLGALTALSGLESLALAGGLDGTPAPALFAPLSHLTSLSLRQDSGELSSAAPLLSGLSQLQRVELCAFRLDAPPADLEAQWGQLRDLVLRSVATPTAVSGEEGGGGAPQGVWDVLPRLHHLTGLTVVAGLVAPVHPGVLRSLTRSPTLQSLRIGRYPAAELPDLPLGGGAALPALTRLRLSVAADLESLPASWCHALAPSLVALEIENCYRLRLPPELSQLSSLQRLGINHQRLEEVPPAVLPLAQLTRLSLCANTLRELAPGPYLRNLRELILFANAFQHVPPALGVASQLQLLDLTMNWDLELSRRQDFEVLGRLGGSLTRLLLQRWPGGSEGGWCRRAPPKVERRLRQLLPHVELVL